MSIFAKEEEGSICGCIGSEAEVTVLEGGNKEGPWETEEFVCTKLPVLCEVMGVLGVEDSDIGVTGGPGRDFLGFKS